MKKNRFIPGYSPLSRQVMLIIEDYAWWVQNDQEITEWMDANLPRGREHQQGMIINFDNNEQRSWFLLRWS